MSARMSFALSKQDACAGAVLVVALAFSSHAWADRVTVEIQGLEGEELESARASVELKEYEDREVTPSQVVRLYERADEQIRLALEPFGYYRSTVSGTLERPDPQTYRAVFKVARGEPVIVRDVRIDVGSEAMQIDAVRQAVERFEPKVGDRLNHQVYERSKQEIETALAAAGYLKSEAVRHRVEVVRASNSAEVDLAWNPQARFRFGPVRFSGDVPFPDSFLERYTPWKEGEFYSLEKLLELQQRLSNADYFSSVSVTPDLEHARDGAVPIDVMLIRDERTVYTAEVYVSTDTGPGGRLGIERRWINDRGHKLRGEIEYSTRLKEASAQYLIPKPGERNRMLTFGAAYRDEETDTSTSRMLRLAATEVTDRWKGFTRTLGLQYLNGDFEIADEQRNTSLLYAEGLLVRKKADDLYFPLSGYSLLYGLRLAAEPVLSDTSLVQLRAEGKQLKQLGEDGRLIVRASLGAMWVEDFDALPPELRFFAGGDRSIRGFDYQQLGERNELDQVIGGEYLAVVSAEYEHYFLENWGLAAFVDAGDAFTDEFRTNVGAGLGLRWKSPVGMVRVDIARPVVTDFDHSWRIHLVIGPDL
ncbi:MAG TPA: autotransporter assembly complex family protein [Steroidobacter sp.]